MARIVAVSSQLFLLRWLNAAPTSSDISQTILGDMFSMTMLTTLDTEKADFNAVQEKLEGVATELGVQITIQREDVFQFMYKI